MKNLLKIVTVFVFALGFIYASAQGNYKLGYIDSNELIELMPGKDSVENQLMEYQKTLESQIETMLAEYQSKVQDYQANVATMSAIIKQTKEKEIMGIKHKDLPVWGVQFHPESILTGEGKRLLKNFINM